MAKTFTYTTIKPPDLTATDLRAEARDLVDAEACTITIYQDGHPMAERAEALYSANAGRLGIAWGADATWGDVASLESGIEMWLNDRDAWAAAN